MGVFQIVALPNVIITSFPPYLNNKTTSGERDGL
jgi:hypothetical protein